MTGDPIEANAVARVFGDTGVHIGSVKPNLGHSEGASGLTSLIKAVMALENRTIPPNIKFNSPNPAIPFKERKLTVPVEPTPWPTSRHERASVNSFGIGGTNAHVIIDSAASTLEAAALRSTTEHSEAPQLLLYSAASANSLKKTIVDYQSMVEKDPEIKLADLAFTLATKREHLPHRSFAIASNGQIGTAAPPERAGAAPNVIMVFTGQGAQWPQMGKELLHSNAIFASTIRSLDKYLHEEVSGGPLWTIEEELLRPARKSNVQKAELSQPLCTAIQVALVDALRAVGIQAAAVVGHSSGELGAAYAAGALTAAEAITAAWRRGLVTQQQTKAGAMAAIGMSRAEVEPFLLPGKVGVACENSPESITLSGDAEEVRAVCARIQTARSDVLVRLLKVDKAYHSHHMVEIGDAYYALIEHDLVRKQPTIPFFSSVHGGLLPGDETLGPRYWQTNLESTVRFREAVTSILQTPTVSKNAVLLEIGPHSALAGPLRQIVQAHGAHANGIPYVASMLRGQDCTESLLTAIGKLHALNVPLDWAALFPAGTGKALPDLPRYAWDHQEGASYWYESRLSSEWRNRKFKQHSLLGIRLPESTDFEPAWRNVLHLDNIPWVRDHKVEDDMIFPAAGYMSMIGEAIRQVTGIEEAFSLRHIVVGAATVLTEGKTVEFVTTLRKHRLTDSLDSDWWEFTIASHNGAVWTKHCTGQAKAQAEALGPSTEDDVTALPRDLAKKRCYEKMSQIGLKYGPHFQALDKITTGTVETRAKAEVANNEEKDSALFHLHPTILDAALQLLSVSATKAYSFKHGLTVPTNFEMLTVHRTKEPVINMDVSANLTATGHIVGNIKAVAGGQVVLKIKEAHLSPLGGAEAESEQTGPLSTARLEWGPHIDFMDTASLIKPSMDRGETTPQLDKLTRLCLVYSQRYLHNVASTEVAHMQKFKDWIDRQLQDTPDISPELHSTDLRKLIEQVDAIVQELASTPAADAAVGMQRVLLNLGSIFDGSANALEILLEDGTLTGLYDFMDECDISSFISTLAHTKPNLRILEIGAGTGASTASILKNLVVGDDASQRILYSKYTFTDISAGFLVSAKERFKNYPNIDYTTLDISKDPAAQGFDDTKADYDLVLATNVLHATASLKETLSHVHQLLAPNGRLLLHELVSTSKWVNYIFGTLAGWWYGDHEGRVDEPYISPAQWEKQLVAAGFRGLDAVVLDSAEPWQLNAVMVARPAPAENMDSKRINGQQQQQQTAVTLVLPTEAGPDDDKSIKPISHELRRRGYAVTTRRLGEDLPASQDTIALLDIHGPFFANISAARLDEFKKLVGGFSKAGLLWVLPLSQQLCRSDPGYAQAIGTLRTLRGEKLLKVGTCEVDAVTSESAVRIVNVFEKFQTQEGDETLDPDYEYAVVNGTVSVGRYYQFSLKEEMLATPPASTEAGVGEKVVLGIDKLARLDTLIWAPRESSPLVGDQVAVETYAAGLNFRVRTIAFRQPISVFDLSKLISTCIGRSQCLGHRRPPRRGLWSRSVRCSDGHRPRGSRPPNRRPRNALQPRLLCLADHHLGEALRPHPRQPLLR